MSYVLLGACRDAENLYVVRSVVSKIQNDVTEIDIYQLKAVKGKKIEIPTSALGGTAVTEQSSLIPSESHTISISDFLKYVKSTPIASEVFSKDVAENLGVKRSQGTLSPDLRYALPLEIKGRVHALFGKTGFICRAYSSDICSAELRKCHLLLLRVLKAAGFRRLIRF